MVEGAIKDVPREILSGGESKLKVLGLLPNAQVAVAAGAPALGSSRFLRAGSSPGAALGQPWVQLHQLRSGAG